MSKRELAGWSGVTGNPSLIKTLQAKVAMNKDIDTAQARIWARTSDRELEAYFRDPENFHCGMRVTALIYAVGRFDDEADWDRGNWFYEWRRKTIRVRVTTKSAYIIEIELMDPKTTDPDHALEMLWRNAEYFWNLSQRSEAAQGDDNT
jgi:hypothetical protein